MRDLEKKQKIAERRAERERADRRRAENGDRETRKRLKKMEDVISALLDNANGLVPADAAARFRARE